MCTVASLKLIIFTKCIYSIDRVLKRIGGSWNKRQVDGDKFICMDRLFREAFKRTIIKSSVALLENDHLQRSGLDGITNINRC